MKQIFSLPPSAFKVIEEFQNLSIGKKVVTCPYHINVRKDRVGLRVLVGKGDPGEIEKEVRIWAKLKDLDLNLATVKQIREFMIDRSIGIDCSGFVVHVLGYVLKCSRKRKIVNYLEFPDNSIVAKIRRLLRPVENIGANNLTSLDNCEKIKDLNKVQPGDLIRSKGRIKNSHHVQLITKVFKEDGFVSEIEYAHSSRGYDDENGVRFGRIQVTDLGAGLEKQNWLEIKNGRNYSYDDYLKDIEDNGIRRLLRVKIPYQEQQQ